MRQNEKQIKIISVNIDGLYRGKTSVSMLTFFLNTTSWS